MLADELEELDEEELDEEELDEDELDDDELDEDELEEDELEEELDDEDVLPDETSVYFFVSTTVPTPVPSAVAVAPV